MYVEAKEPITYSPSRFSGFRLAQDESWVLPAVHSYASVTIALCCRQPTPPTLGTVWARTMAVAHYGERWWFSQRGN
jgi:hypothetical protein